MNDQLGNNLLDAVLQERVNRLAARLSARPEWVDEMLYLYDWPNLPEHRAWTETASDAEIAGWLSTLLRDNPEGLLP